MNLNAWLTTITGAAVLGLVILNAKGTADVINAAGSNVVKYIEAVQGRG